MAQISKEEMQKILEQQDREEFRQWRDHPVTEALFKYLQAKREELKEQWAEGRFVSADPLASARDNTLAHATTGVIKELLELEAFDLRENDDE